MKHQFKHGDGVICSTPEEATRLRTLAFDNGYNCFGNTPNNDESSSFMYSYTNEFISCVRKNIANPIHPDTFEALVTGKSVPVGNLCLCERLGVDSVTYMENKTGYCIDSTIYGESNGIVKFDERNSLQSTLEKALQLAKEGKENEAKELVKGL